jgi:hypothetical protein
LAACNTSFMVGFFLPNRPDILLGGPTGLAAEAGVAWRRRGEVGALSWARSQLANTCVLARGMRRVAQSTRHRNAAVFLSMTDYRSLAHKFSVAFFVHVVQQRNPGAPVSAQHALTWHYG